jgi:DNA-binding MarR family transcriptional regulator
MPLTTLSDAVRRLEARTLVRRRRNPDDGRSSLLELTPRGDREWRAGWGALRRISEALKREVDEEEMRDALTRLGDAFESILADGPAPDPMASN